MPEHNYGFGDRVRALTDGVDGDFDWPPAGSEGTVVRPGSMTMNLRVDWSENPGCPAGSGRDWMTHAGRIEPAQPPAFYLVQASPSGEFVPVPNENGFTDGKRAADRAKLLSQYYGHKVQVRPIAKDLSTSRWCERERERLESGAYTAMPEGWDLEPIPDHFLHLSKEDAKLVAYTDSPEKGVLDRQTKLLPGRYLEKFYPHVPDLERKRLIALVDRPDRLHFAVTADEIEAIYTGGPRSCMSRPASSYDGFCHPVRAYGDSDISVAYIKNGDTISARSIVWREKKIHGRIYGDEARMRLALGYEGFSDGYRDNPRGFEGARMAKIYDPRRRAYVGPYLDGDYTAVSKSGAELDGDAGEENEVGFGVERLTVDSPSTGSPRSKSGSCKIKSGSAKTGFFTLCYGFDNTCEKVNKGKSSSVVQFRSESGLGTSYRYCPRLDRLMRGSGFKRVILANGTAQLWSEEAVELHAAYAQDPETGRRRLYEADLVVEVHGLGTVFKDRIPEGYVQCFSSKTYYPLSQMHDLGDGRSCSKMMWSRYGAVCSGNGRSYLRTTDSVRGINGRYYSMDFLQEVADEKGITVNQAYDRIATGRLNPPDRAAAAMQAA